MVSWIDPFWKLKYHSFFFLSARPKVLFMGKAYWLDSPLALGFTMLIRGSPPISLVQKCLCRVIFGGCRDLEVFLFSR